jgi:LysM repeat protein
MSFADKQARIGKATLSGAQTLAIAPNPSVESTGPEEEFITYTVRNGDTIWDIVKMYGDVSASQVLSLNNISDPGKIKIGQKLKIKKKS